MRTCDKCGPTNNHFYSAKWATCAKCFMAPMYGADRTCTNCKMLKPATAFYKEWDSCISCNFNGSMTQEEKQKKNRENSRRFHEEWKARDLLGYKKHMMCRAAAARAKKAGLPFNLTPEDIVIPEYCPALGIKLEVCTSGKGHHPSSPSLDKIIPSLGYVKGNVVVVSMLANQIKTYATPEQVLAVGQYYVKLTSIP